MGWFRGKRFSVAETIGLVSTGILLIQLGDGFAREGSAGAADKGASPLDYMRVELGAINGLKGPHLIIEGANVHVRSGGGSTRRSTVATSSAVGSRRAASDGRRAARQA